MPVLTPKQNEYIRNASRRWNLKIGAVRSGKSFVDIAYVIPSRLRTVADKAGLNVILGVSRETIESNVLQPMREIYTEAIVGTINNKNIAEICGVPVYCLGAEKRSQVSKLQGKSVKYCYGDEIARWNQEVFYMLESRLDKPYSCFDGSCNPESPNHWLKQFIDKPDIDAYIQKYTIFDNPTLPEFFIDNLCKEYEGTVYYGRYITGEWTSAQGLIYPMYRKALESPPDSVAEVYVLSVDYGTQNAFAALMWGRYDGVWYAVDGYYHSGRDTNVQKTDGEYGKDLEKFVHKYTDKKILVAIDPSAASFIALLRKTKWANVRKADNAVSDGIRETATAMQKGLIKINPAIKEWKKEVEGYVWDDKSTDEKPVKTDDHYMDSMRYFVKTFSIARPKANYKAVW